MRTTSVALAAMLASTPAVSSAQTRWDLAGVAGLFAGHTTAGDVGLGYQEDWFHSAQGGLVAGAYLSRHLKFEVEATGTTGGSRYVSYQVSVPGGSYPYFITSRETTSVRSLGATVAWQFGENAWVHPFVQAGVSADWDRTVLHTPEQFYYSDPRAGVVPQRMVDERALEDTTFHLRPVIGGGAKFYFHERGFVRTDARLMIGRDRQYLALRAGVGFDF